VNGCVELDGDILVDISGEDINSPILIFNRSCRIDLSPVQIHSQNSDGCESAFLEVQEVDEKRLGVYVRFTQEECDGVNKGAIIGGAIAGFFVLLFIIVLLLLIFVEKFRRMVWPHREEFKNNEMMKTTDLQIEE